MSDVKKVVLKQMGSGEEEYRGDRKYKVVQTENTLFEEIGKVIDRDGVRKLMSKPNTKVVVK